MGLIHQEPILKPKVSIITICYNAADVLDKTIQSVIEQTYENKEYIIIDGGSKDNTSEVIDKHIKHITKWVSEIDEGIYDAMNKGIKIASGEWIIMMNAGDCFSDSFVIERIFSSPIPSSISFIYSDVYNRSAKESLIVREMSFEKGVLNHQSTIYKKSLHDEFGLYAVTPKLIVSDYLFFIRVPYEMVMKTDVIISIFDNNGISSQGNWALQQSLCADVVFCRRTFWGMIRFYLWKKIKSIIPIPVKDYIKKAL